jgi:hypothetical protein
LAQHPLAAKPAAACATDPSQPATGAANAGGVHAPDLPLAEHTAACLAVAELSRGDRRQQANHHHRGEVN